MNRPVEVHAKRPSDGATRLRIGLIMLGGVVASQVIVTVAVGADPLQRWAPTPTVHVQAEARDSGVTQHLVSSR
ncbi:MULTISPECIES: hypothetical protein [Sphingomonadaceae]|uniref:hypothetical protein n=1 Tax=Sphingomonadales TaxID=204457 RepID=UPI00076FEAD1|nr:hypothetical protein [Sphingobium sp. TKS]AMK22912.1 hypothetical protein K426_09835 [Sphingobium sp. TKS]MCF8706651.1 hypothetical protein [Rhizorhapis sp. SPR117]